MQERNVIISNKPSPLTKADVLARLTQYKNNQGYLRWMLGDPTIITTVREFANSLNDGNLSLDSLVAFSEILKNNDTVNGSESHAAITDLRFQLCIAILHTTSDANVDTTRLFSLDHLRQNLLAAFAHHPHPAFLAHKKVSELLKDLVFERALGNKDILNLLVAQTVTHQQEEKRENIPLAPRLEIPAAPAAPAAPSELPKQITQRKLVKEEKASDKQELIVKYRAGLFDQNALTSQINKLKKVNPAKNDQPQENENILDRMRREMAKRRPFMGSH